MRKATLIRIASRVGATIAVVVALGAVAGASAPEAQAAHCFTLELGIDQFFICDQGGSYFSNGYGYYQVYYLHEIHSGEERYMRKVWTRTSGSWRLVGCGYFTLNWYPLGSSTGCLF